MNRHFAGATLIEVGCGKGLFLERSARQRLRRHRPRPDLRGQQPARDQEVLHARGSACRADGIVLRHVLEHVRRPGRVSRRPAEANGGERHGSTSRCRASTGSPQHHAWFDIFYEHVNYFRLRRLRSHVRHACTKPGTSFGGQYLYVVADLATLASAARRADDAFALPPDFLSAFDRAARRACGAAAERGRGRSGAVRRRASSSPSSWSAPASPIDTVDRHQSRPSRAAISPATGLRVRVAGGGDGASCRPAPTSS